MALPPPPEPSVLEVLQGLVIKLREGTSYAEQLQKKFGKKKIHSPIINLLINECIRDLSVTRITERDAQQSVVNHKLHILFRKSRNRVRKLRRDLDHFQINEAHFLNTTQNTFYDLRPKLNDILTELAIGLHVHSWHAAEDSPSNSESDSDEGNRSDTTSGSDDGSDNNGLNNGVTDKIEKHERDFRKLYNICLVLGVERDNYIILQKACTE